MRIKQTIFVLLMVVSSILRAENYLEKTIIVKVKPAYASFCSQQTISHPLFTQTAQKLQVYNIEKMFPNKSFSADARADLALIYIIKYAVDISELEASNKISRLSCLSYAEPYIIPELCFTPNDPDVTNQYYLNLVNAYTAWDIQKGDTNVVIGITDTGWDPSHPDLINNIKKNYDDPINGFDDDNDGYTDNFLGWDLGMNDNDALYESTSHGVHVSGLAAATTNNGTGIASIGFKTKFLPVKISTAAGVLTHAYQGIVYAADQGCQIINCSWGSYAKGKFQQDVIKYAQQKGCLIVAALGNNSTETKFYPACYDGVLTVAATDQNDSKKNNSNFGYHTDICAPGEAIYSTVGFGTYANNGGTSMASPQVAAAAALVKAQFPSLTNAQIIARLKATADDISPQNTGYDDKLGGGRLNVYTALTAVNLEYIELDTVSITDNNNNTFIIGDTLSIVADVANYLNPLTGVVATLTTTSPNINIISGSFNYQNFTTNQVKSNSSLPFKVEVIGGLINDVVTFKLTISNGSYSTNCYFDVTINPDFINVQENLISTTITSKSKIGYNDNLNTTGIGFQYKGEQLLHEAGFMIGDGQFRVANQVRGDGFLSADFESWVNVKNNPPYKSDLDLDGLFSDFYHHHPMELMIRHNTYVYQNAPNDKFIILTYNVENTSNQTYSNVAAGIFADWDAINSYTNICQQDAALNLAYTKSINDSMYVGIKLLSSQQFNHYAIDNSTGGMGGVDIADGYTESEKYQTLTTNRATAGGSIGGDVVQVVSGKGVTLAPAQEELFAFALLVGDSLLDLKNGAIAAQTAYNNDALMVDNIDLDMPVSLYPNPSKGNVYIEAENNIHSVKILNMYGQVIIYKNNIYRKKTQFDLRDYQSGVYFFIVNSGQNQTSHKLIITK